MFEMVVRINRGAKKKWMERAIKMNTNEQNKRFKCIEIDWNEKWSVIGIGTFSLFK